MPETQRFRSLTFFGNLFEGMGALVIVAAFLGVVAGGFVPGPAGFLESFLVLLAGVVAGLVLIAWGYLFHALRATYVNTVEIKDRLAAEASRLSGQ